MLTPNDIGEIIKNMDKGKTQEVFILSEVDFKCPTCEDEHTIDVLYYSRVANNRFKLTIPCPDCRNDPHPKNVRYKRAEKLTVKRIYMVPDSKTGFSIVLTLLDNNGHTTIANRCHVFLHEPTGDDLKFSDEA